MSLAAGTRLGPYEILGLIGAGGMGEVYKARDTRLERTVAIKVLPAAFSDDSDRRRHFEQEARAVSSLNHAHICVLHDVGVEAPHIVGRGKEARGDLGDRPAPVPFLVMEHLEGQTLADRLLKGPLPIAQALDLGIQIADALAAAHRAGVVHRDLKPPNVMLVKTPGGQASAKLLDFGLARLMPRLDHDVNGVTQSAPGTVSGTAPYMSPEQVEGRPVDARTDLFAFGCVLYEMLTARRAFDGANPASVMAAILCQEPRAASALQPAISPAIDRVLTRCLAKDPDARWQTASDLAAQLRWLRETPEGGSATAPPPMPARQPGRRGLALAAFAVALFAAGAATMWTLRPAARSAGGVGLDLHPAEIPAIGMAFGPGGTRTAFAWSADGRTLVIGNAYGLFARSLVDAVARPITNTEGAQVPAVSPDGRLVAFWTPAAKGRPGGIKSVPFGGGPVLDVVPDAAKPAGMAWDDTGGLFFGNADDHRIWHVGADGTAKPATSLADGETAHVLPAVPPGGKVLLYTVRKRLWSWGDEVVVAQRLADGTRKPLLTDAADARYLPSGHVVFMRHGQLMAVAFDLARLEAQGKQEVVQDAVAQALAGMSSGNATGAGQFAVSPTGALAWVRSPAVDYPDATLVAVDRHGAVTRLRAEARPYIGSVRVSPDGRRLAVSTQTTSTGAVWVYDMQRTTLEMVLEGGEGVFAFWWPKDVRRLLVDRRNDGRTAFAWVPAYRGGQARVLRPSGLLQASSFAPDGRLVLLRRTESAGAEVVVTDIDDDHAPYRVVVDAAEKPDHPEVSRDGRWLAYTASAAAIGAKDPGWKLVQGQVYVKPLDGPGAHVPVSVDGGDSPAWSPTGDEVFFTSPRMADDGTFWMMAADFTPGTPPRIGAPRKLFEFFGEELGFLSCSVRCYDVAPDGQHFYVVRRNILDFPSTVTHVNYSPHWLDEVKAKVPTTR